MNVKEIRRKNLRALARVFGGVTKLADHLNRKQSQLSHLIGTNPVKGIGDRFAAHVEKLLGKPTGWLDHEHYDIQETNGIYQNNFVKRAYFQAPLLTWHEAEIWLKGPAPTSAKNVAQTLVTHVPLSPQAFAVKVEGDSMEAPSGTSFPRDCIIIADTDQVAQNGAYAIVQTAAEAGLVFRQLIIDGNRRYLKPLHERYPIIELPVQSMIYAIVKVMLQEFK